MNDWNKRLPRNKLGATQREVTAAMSGKTGGEYVTVYEAEKMIAQFLKDYEKEVVEPRDIRNVTKLENIERIVQQGSGAMKAAGALLSLASLVWIVIQIIHATKT